MTTMRRKFRFRFRFGFGLAAAIAALALLAPAANAAKPKPTPTPGTAAANQYAAPTVVTYVTLKAAKAGKCKLAVVKRYVVKKRACRGKKPCLAIVGKAEIAAKKQCDRAAAGTKRPVKKPTVKKPVTKKPAAKKP